MRFNNRLFAATLARESGVMAPLILVAAMVSVYVAATAAKSATTSIVTSVRNPADRSVALVKTPLDATELGRSAARLSKLAPAVRIAVSSKDIVVSIQAPEQFAEFMYALTALQSMAADVVWEPTEMCLNACDGGDIARARITGIKQSLTQVDTAPPKGKSS